MSVAKRNRCSEFQSNSITDEVYSENGKDSSHWALEIPLVFRRIMSHLSVPEILHNCSLVNKFWCREARLFLRDKRTCTLCTALLKSSEDVEVVDNLISSKVIPFNRISVYCPQEFGRGTTPSMVRLEQQILQLIEIMTLKTLYIRENELECHCDRRMSRNIIEQALRKRNETIEEISLCLKCTFYPALKIVTQELLTSENFCLPALRTLAFYRKQRVWPGLIEDFVVPVIAAAPKLKNIFLAFPFMAPRVRSVTPLLPAGHVHLLKSFRFSIVAYNQEEWNWLLTSVEVECKQLELILCSQLRNNEHQLPVILKLLCPFLMRNRNSITFLATDVPTILILHQTGLLELFPRLKYLSLKIERHGADRREELFPAVSNFSQTFPELVSLALEGHGGEVREERTQAPKQNDGSRGGLKELIVRECYNETVIETWAGMLQEIEHLVVTAAPDINDVVDLSHIWLFWPSLVSLQVIYRQTNSLIFNSSVCGLDEAEVKLLQKKSLEELKQSVIVPKGPSITGMTSLKHFRVSVVSEKAYWKKMKCTVPKVYQALTFGRINNLKVQFEYVHRCFV